MDRTTIEAIWRENICRETPTKPCNTRAEIAPLDWCDNCQLRTLSQLVLDLRAKLETADAEATDWHLVADGVKHHPDCVNNAAGGGDVLTCSRCEAESLRAKLETAEQEKARSKQLRTVTFEPAELRWPVCSRCNERYAPNSPHSCACGLTLTGGTGV